MPFFCAEQGAKTYTVDSGSPSWEGAWGYFDYGSLNPAITSFNADFCSLPWAGAGEFDSIVSISVVEHLPATVRRASWCEFSRVLKPNGKLVLTLDLQLDGFTLWNRSRSVQVESVSQHGTLASLLDELHEAGFVLERSEACPGSTERTRVVGLVLRKIQTEPLRAEVGHVMDKYDSHYFLGGVMDADTGRPYAVYGDEAYRAGRLNDRLEREFAFVRALTGGLKDKDVLEIGFGRGETISLFLEAQVASYAGLEFSRSALEIAQARNADPRITLSLMDATRLEAHHAFDFIVLLDVIEHIPAYEMESVWPKLRHALRPGGYIVLSTPIFENPNAADHSDEIPSISGMHCHKQTWGTLVRTAIRHGLIVARTADRILGLVRAEDLAGFDLDRQTEYRTAHKELLARFGLDSYTGLSLTDELSRRLVPGAGRIALGCVAENNVKLLAQALRLLQSLRWFGGSMAGANFFVCVVDGLDESYAREFERWGAFIRIVSRWNPDNPHSNKLRLLELPELSAYDTVMLIDCDTLIAQDPYRFLDGLVLQAKIADQPTISLDTFDRVFHHFGLPLPPAEYSCNPEGTRTIWYCNSGVLVMPQPIVQRLSAAWQRAEQTLSGRIDLLGPSGFHLDQAGLAVAFASDPVPFRELPLAMNFPIHLPDVLTSRAMMETDPVIVHYHDRVDASGYLLPSSYPGARKRIQAFNDRLRETRRHSFDNRLFWDYRYTEAPELGSGVGSRGSLLEYKRGLLARLIRELEPQSVLDIGCGDLALSGGLLIPSYVGVDISPVVIEENRKRMPQGTFICGDFLDLDLKPADLVLCVDVLIHLSDRQVYTAFVERLVSRAAKWGVVTGYEQDPQMGEGMVFYHEPLSRTLDNCGARAVRKIGEYAKASVYYFEVPQWQGSVESQHQELAALEKRYARLEHAYQEQLRAAAELERWAHELEGAALKQHVAIEKYRRWLGPLLPIIRRLAKSPK